MLVAMRKDGPKDEGPVFKPNLPYAKSDMSPPAIVSHLNPNSFSMDRAGKKRTHTAARKAKCQSATTIVEAVKSAGSVEHQRTVLHSALSHLRVGEIAKSIGVDLKKIEAAMLVLDQVKSITDCICATCKSNDRGSMDHNARVILNAAAMVTSETSSPSPEDGMNKPINKRKKKGKVSTDKIRKELWPSKGMDERIYKQ